MGTNGAGKRLIAERKSIGQHVAAVEQIDLIIAPKIGGQAADDGHADEIPIGDESSGSRFGKYNRLSRIDNAERAKVHRTGDGAVVVIAPTGHVDGIDIEIGEFDEFAASTGVHVFSDADDAATRCGADQVGTECRIPLIGSAADLAIVVSEIVGAEPGTAAGAGWDRAAERMYVRTGAADVQADRRK